ncbi:MAG: PAS domain-containing protein [Lachnospiraceae bacterium]|nr:PAS domain-containing protein [Lachnospiraceae bacterium]
MKLEAYFKSVLEQDRAAVVICDLKHEIIYMNPAAIENYEKYGGAALLGKSLLDCHSPESRERINEVVAWFEEKPDHNIVFTSHDERKNKDVYMAALRDDSRALIGYYEKHEYRNPESGKRYDLS